MRLLIAAPYFYPEGSGLEHYAWQVARGAVTAGHYVTVVCCTREGGDRVEQRDGMTIYRFAASAVASATPLRWGLYRRVRRLIEEVKPDLAHLHTPVPFVADVAGLACRRSRVPYIVTYHASSLVKGSLLIDTIARCYLPVQMMLLRGARQVVGVADNVVAGPLRRYVAKASVITPGVDVTQFPAGEDAARDPQLALFVGSLHRATSWKGLSVLLRAFEQIADQRLRLEVAGDGDMREVYERQVRELGLSERVRFLGKLDHRALATAYQRAAVVVLPSTSHAEGCPTVMFEAMSSGAVVIGSSVGGIQTVIRDGQNGVLVPAGDVAELTIAVADLLVDPARQMAYRQQAFLDVRRHFTWEHVVQQYLALYTA